MTAHHDRFVVAGGVRSRAAASGKRISNTPDLPNGSFLESRTAATGSKQLIGEWQLSATEPSAPAFQRCTREAAGRLPTPLMGSLPKGSSAAARRIHVRAAIDLEQPDRIRRRSPTDYDIARTDG